MVGLPETQGSDFLSDSAQYERMWTRMISIAWFRYRIPRDQAEDVFQTAAAAFLEVRHRYEVLEEHPAIFVGVFRKKCLEHIDRSAREGEKVKGHHRRIRDGSVIERGVMTMSSPLDRLVSDEEVRAIVRILRDISPVNRQMLRLVAERGRRAAQEELGINPNTFDSRLHVLRKQVKQKLRRLREAAVN